MGLKVSVASKVNVITADIAAGCDSPVALNLASPIIVLIFTMHAAVPSAHATHASYAVLNK